jgi:hypothetical protein
MAFSREKKNILIKCTWFDTGVSHSHYSVRSRSQCAGALDTPGTYPMSWTHRIWCTPSVLVPSTRRGNIPL